MTKTSKKHSVILGVLLAVLLFFAGLFCVLKENKTRTIAAGAVASTATSTSEDFYFHPGALANVGTLDPFKMRFTLYINEGAFEDGSFVQILFADESLTNWTSSPLLGKGCEFIKDQSVLPVSSEYLNAYNNVIYFNTAGLTYTDGVATLHIAVRVPVSLDVRLDAYVTTDFGTDQTTLASAKSDTRNCMYLWQNYCADPDYEVKSEFVKSAVDFVAGDTTAFRISDFALLSDESGLTFYVNIPESWRALLYGTVTASESKYINASYNYQSYTKYTDYYLEIRRTTDLTNYTNGTYLETSGEESYLFYGDKKTHEFGTLGEQISADFETSTFGTVSIPIPSSNVTEYYYYARVIKRVTWTEPMGGPYNSLYYQKYCTETVAATSNNNLQTSNQTMAEDLLAAGYASESQRVWLQDVTGLTPSTENIEVTLIKKELKSGVIVETNEYTFQVKACNAYSPKLVESTLYSLKDYSNLAKFNVVRTGDYWQNDRYYETMDRIILQADSLEYVYDSTTEKGTLTVEYKDFQYKDVCLQISNNDPLDPMVVDYYVPADKVVVGDTTTTLTFDFNTIQSHLYNSAKWLFQLEKANVTVTDPNSFVTVTDTAIVVTFANETENELAGLSLAVNAEIRPDEDYAVTIEYKKLSLDSDNNIVVDTKTSSEFTLLYSEVNALSFTSFMIDYGTTINNAIALDCLSGDYLVPYDIDPRWSPIEDDPTCTLVVLYEYNALFRLSNNLDSEVKYQQLDDTSLTYGGERILSFYGDIPTGYRVEGFESSSEYLVLKNAENYADASFEVRAQVYEDIIIPITINFTDKWHLQINYFETYKDTCFAVKKSKTQDVRYADYPDLYALTLDDVKTILGMETLRVCDMVNPDPMSEDHVEFDKVSLYTATLTYGHASLTQIDYDGNKHEIKVPLTSYVDWCAQYGSDWSILFLNTKDRMYFENSNDVAREDLYGFFSVAVFETQVSDLNYWFQNNTGAGQMTIFTQREARGSSLYEFFDELTADGVFLSILGYTGMALCEVLDDKNAVYYSYFFYLDGSCKNAFISNGGADDAFDTDDALDNTVQDVGDALTSFGESPFGTVLSLLLGVIVLAVLAIAVYWVLMKLGIIKPGIPKTPDEPKDKK